MHIEKDMYGDEVVMYDSREEELAANKNYLRGNYAALTCEEIKFFRSCMEDPNMTSWEAEHAGRFAENVDELDFYGLVFVYNLGHSFEEGVAILHRMVGPRPITNLVIWELNRRLSAAANLTHSAL